MASAKKNFASEEVELTWCQWQVQKNFAYEEVELTWCQWLGGGSLLSPRLGPEAGRAGGKTDAERVLR